LRGWKQVASGNRYFFLYDGDQIVCGFDGNGNLSRINVWGASGLIGRQSGTNGGTPVYDYAWDDRGNISQVLNTNSSVASNYLVSAWGEASTDSAAYDPYRCMGGQFGNYFDQETGLILCGQRYYDPSGGRWINRDPISYAGGLNVYGYVGNNPVNFIDPDGLDGAPNLPPRIIAQPMNGWRIEHLYHSQEHGPAHAHLFGPRGENIQITSSGHPWRGEGPIPAAAKKVINANKMALRRAVSQCGRWLVYQEKLTARAAEQAALRAAERRAARQGIARGVLRGIERLSSLFFLLDLISVDNLRPYPSHKYGGQA